MVSQEFFNDILSQFEHPPTSYWEITFAMLIVDDYMDTAIRRDSVVHEIQVDFKRRSTNWQVPLEASFSMRANGDSFLKDLKHKTITTLLGLGLRPKGANNDIQ